MSGMHCEECGQILLWAGADREPHPPELHDAMRRLLYRAIWKRAGQCVWRKATGE